MNAYTKKNLKKGVELSYTDNGYVEVLVSPGYGAGWSTWNEFSVAVDKRIIDYFKEHGNKVPRGEVEKFIESLGYKHCYAGGWNRIEIRKVPVGSRFEISEYDGFEDLKIFGDDNCYKF